MKNEDNSVPNKNILVKLNYFRKIVSHFVLHLTLYSRCLTSVLVFANQVNRRFLRGNMLVHADLFFVLHCDSRKKMHKIREFQFVRNFSVVTK